MSVLDTIDICKYVAGCAAKAGVSVVWEKDEKPRTDGRTIYLPHINAYSAPKNIVKLKQFVKHETSHITYSDFAILEREKPQGMLMFVFNLLEDHRVDWLNDSEYTGDKYNTEAYMQVFADECEERKHPISDDMRDMMAPLFSWDADVREDLWVRASDVFHKHMSEKGKTIYRKLHDGDYAEVLRNIRDIADSKEGGEQVFALAKRIITEVFEVDADELCGGASGEGEGATGDGSDSEGEGSESDGVASGSDDEEGDGDKEEAKARTKKLRDVDMKGEKIQPYAAHSPSEGANAHNYDVGVDKEYTPTPFQEVGVVDYTTGKVVNHGYYRDVVDKSVLAEITRLASHSSALKNNIRTQLQIISRARWEYGKKKGKLNNASLYRVGMRDAKGLNERLFKEQVNTHTLDVAVQVLVDASGSMSGAKFANASAAAILLNEVLAVGLNIPLEILAFTELGTTHTMFIHKTFDRPMPLPSMARNFANTANYLCDNVDGESLVFGYNRLIGRKEKRKLMIVLSDGQPCGGHAKGRCIPHTRQVIRAIEKSPIELMGVGVMYDCSDYYKKSAYIESASKIEEALLSIVSNNVLRSI